jgi:excinuclease ABC subunit C
VGYNRKRRTMRTVTSALLAIPGIGPVKRRALLSTFGSLQGVRDASVEQIAAVEGFSEVTARKVKEALRTPEEREASGRDASGRDATDHDPGKGLAATDPD